MFLERIVLVSMVVNIRAEETKSCLESRDTVTEVHSCPRNKDEWILRSKLKQCSVEQCAGKSVYHCVINSFANGTLEVCAPSALILGKTCVEYNFRSTVIQGSPYKKCSDSCPFSYNSTEAYKYQECFESVHRDKDTRSTEEIKNSTKGTWNKKTTIFMITTFVFAGSTLLMFVLFLLEKKKNKQNKRGRNEFQVKGDGHVDLQFVKLEKDYKERKQNIKDSPISKTVPWKEHTLPIDCVLNFFERIYGGKAIDNWKNSTEYIYFLFQFEELIKEIDECTHHDKEYTLSLSKELVKDYDSTEQPEEESKEKLLRKDKTQCIEEKIKDSKEIRLGDNNWTFKVTFKWIKTHFNGIKSQVETILKGSWRESETEAAKCVVLTGAYSKTKIIWDIAENFWFKDKNVTIVVPADTHVFAMGGAYYGQRKEWLDEQK